MSTRSDLKGITNAAVPLYGSIRCHLMVQGTHKMSQLGARSFKDRRARWAVPVNQGSCQTERRTLADFTVLMSRNGDDIALIDCKTLSSINVTNVPNAVVSS
jgi:hypothetical protein